MSEEPVEYSLSAGELRKWPLIHGSPTMSSNLHAIRNNGLLSPSETGGGLNSFDYDRILGRTEYVYLSVPRLRGNYGLGSFILVDPRVLELSGVTCALYDVGEVVLQVERLSEDPSHQLPEWIEDPTWLRNLVLERRECIRRELHEQDIPYEYVQLLLEQCTVKNVVASSEFRDYAAKHLMNPDRFYAALEDRYTEQEYTFTMFLNRTHVVLGEEILVPRRVEPHYLLGYWDRQQWHQWVESADNEISARVGALVSLSRQAPIE